MIEIDAASNRGINEMRELRENVRYQPARDRYKVFIVDEAHQITSEAFNALLKTIEEGPVVHLAHGQLPPARISRAGRWWWEDPQNKECGSACWQGYTIEKNIIRRVQ